MYPSAARLRSRRQLPSRGLRCLMPGSVVMGLAWLAPAAGHATAGDVGTPGLLVTEFAGGRSEGMGRAHRGDGRNNETLTYNPAGMALTPRYSIDLQYGHMGARHLNDIALSVVDSKSSPVSAGIRATRAWGNPDGLDVGIYQLAAGSAFAIGDRLALGLTVKHHRGHWRPDPESEADELSLWTGTIGAMARISQSLSVGLVGENLVRVQPAYQGMLRPAVGAGAALTLGRVNLAADARIDLRDGASRSPDIAVGAEALIVTGLAARAGYFRDQTWPGAPRQQGATFGLGLLSTAASFNLSVERTFGALEAWSIFTGIQMSV